MVFYTWHPSPAELRVSFRFNNNLAATSMTDPLSGFNRFMLARASGRNLLLLLAITLISFGFMAAVITPAFQEATDFHLRHPTLQS